MKLPYTLHHQRSRAQELVDREQGGIRREDLRLTVDHRDHELVVVLKQLGKIA